MAIKRILGATALGGVAAVTIAATLVAVDPDITARAAESAGVSTVAFGFGHGDGWHGRGRHGGFARFCSEARGERMEKMLGFVENFMEFSEPQRAAWNELAAAVRSADGKLDGTCAAIREQGRPEKAPEKLAMMEKMIEGALGGVREVRPAFDKFYGTLSEKQQAALDGLFQRGGRHH